MYIVQSVYNSKTTVKQYIQYDMNTPQKPIQMAV